MRLKQILKAMSLMKNKMKRVLEYIAIALMVLNIVGYGVRKSISCIVLFGMGAYIARCFSKTNVAGRPRGLK